MMKTYGTVIWSDQNRGMFKVQCENGRHSIVEIQDDIDISINDIISGDLLNYGADVELYSSDQDKKFDAIIQDTD